MTSIPDLLIPLDITDAWIDMHMRGQPKPKVVTARAMKAEPIREEALPGMTRS